jgi:hypothetical protein
MPDLVPVDHDPFADEPQLVGNLSEAMRRVRSGERISTPDTAPLDRMVDSAIENIAEPGRRIGDWLSQQQGPNPPGFGALLGPLAEGVMTASMFVPPAAGRLPMDLASRVARAEAMGFRTDLPLYHGTATEFPAFDPRFRGSMTGAPIAKTGVSAAVDPEFANYFAQLAGRKGGDQQIYPLLHRADNPVSLTLRGDENPIAIAGRLLDAWDAGHDAVMIENFPTARGPQKFVVVKNENQLRSRFATFDPARKWDPDLLAAIAGIGATPALGVMAVDHDPFAEDQERVGSQTGAMPP